MDNTELADYLKDYNSTNVKIIVCAIDQLPHKLKKNCIYAFIINLSKITDGNGSHWVALFIDRARNGSYYDSYGFRPKSFYLIDFIRKHCKTLDYNKKQVQQLSSKVCGLYAATFLIHMLNGHSLELYTKKFSKNLLLNDSFIIKNYNYYLRNKNNYFKKLLP